MHEHNPLLQIALVPQGDGLQLSMTSNSVTIGTKNLVCQKEKNVQIVFNNFIMIKRYFRSQYSTRCCRD